MKLLNKKYAVLILVFVLMAPLGCEKQLDVTNPNNPTPDIVKSEEGMKRQALGLWNGGGGGWWEWVSWTLLEAMGDNVVLPWINFDWNRFFGNIELIEYSDGTAPWSPRMQASPSFSQTQWVNFVNDRQVTGGGYEAQWESAYRFNNEANRILQALDSQGGVPFSSNAQEKEDAYRSWAHFWKGYAYQMVGLFYNKGLIIDEPDATNSDYQNSAQMIEAAQAEYDLALQTASSFGVIASAVIPDIFPTNITTASYIQNIYTLKARALLMSKRRTNITQAEWQQIRDWANQGLMTNDGALVIDSDESTYLFAVTHRWRLATNIWARVSPRVVQVVNENPNGTDARAARFQFDSSGGTYANRVTQPQINSPWLVVAGTPYASQSPGTPQFVVSAEENMLMLAEAELALGNPGTAADWVNQERKMPLQQAGLPDETSVDMTTIRNERKIALFGRALAFYDARRLGEIDSQADGGGVQGAWVYHIDSNQNLVLDSDASLFFDFLSYYDIPAAEQDFNPPVAGTPQQ